MNLIFDREILIFFNDNYDCDYGGILDFLPKISRKEKEK